MGAGVQVGTALSALLLCNGEGVLRSGNLDVRNVSAGARRSRGVEASSDFIAYNTSSSRRSTTMTSVCSAPRKICSWLTARRQDVAASPGCVQKVNRY